MEIINTNSLVPDLKFELTGESPRKFSDFYGKPLILYFYPKDNTPGCTIEAKDFRDNFKKFQQLDVNVLGVSRDTLKRHEGFREKHSLPFNLISDADEELCQLFDVIKQKKMFGKIVRGIQRSTFLIDQKGVVRKIWRKVSIKGHVDEVLETAQQIV